MFYEIFSFCYNSVLVCRLSFRAGVYGTKTGMFSRKIKFVIFACSPASIAAALSRRTNGVSGVFGGKKMFFPRFFQKSGRGLGQSPIKSFSKACSSASIAAALRRTFFACTKKVPKKYTEGLRALLTPGDAVKLRLRFAPQVLRRYRKFHIFIKRKNTHIIFMP